VQGALNAIGTMFTNIWNGIKDYVARAVETVRMILLIAWAAIQRGVSDAWTGIRKWIEDAWAGIVGFFNSLPDRLVAIGRDIINGLVNGIKSAGDAIGQAIQGVIDRAIEDIKKNLGIGSPSKVFADMGTNLMSGLALGIRNSAELPQAALDGVMNGVTSPSIMLAGGTGAPGSVTNTTTFNVQTDEMGMALLLERQRRLHLNQFEASM
jgi:phage-related protein